MCYRLSSQALVFQLNCFASSSLFWYLSPPVCGYRTSSSDCCTSSLWSFPWAGCRPAPGRHSKLDRQMRYALLRNQKRGFIFFCYCRREASLKFFVARAELSGAVDDSFGLVHCTLRLEWSWATSGCIRNSFALHLPVSSCLNCSYRLSGWYQPIWMWEPSSALLSFQDSLTLSTSPSCPCLRTGSGYCSGLLG